MCDRHAVIPRDCRYLCGMLTSALFKVAVQPVIVALLVCLTPRCNSTNAAPQPPSTQLPSFPRPPPPPRSPVSHNPGNIATRKHVYASARWSANIVDDHDSYTSTDGNLKTVQQFGGDIDPLKWLSLDLGDVYDLSRVIIYVKCCRTFIANSEVRIGVRRVRTLDDTAAIPENQLVWRGNASSFPWPGYLIRAPHAIDIVMEPPVRGRWITMQDVNNADKDDVTAWLGISEFEVYDITGLAGSYLTSFAARTSPFAPFPPRSPPAVSSSTVERRPSGPSIGNLGWNKATYTPAATETILPSADGGVDGDDYAMPFWTSDGNLGTVQYFGTYGARSNWFSVNLGSVQQVGHIVIFADMSRQPSFLLNAEVRIGNQSIRVANDTAAIPNNPLACKGSVFEGATWSDREVFQIFFEPPLLGRWITFQDMKPGPGGSGNGTAWLGVAEFEVYAQRGPRYFLWTELTAYASAIVASVSTGKEFVAAIANTSVNYIRILNDINLTEADWNTLSGSQAARSTSLTISGDGTSVWPVLDLGYAKGKVQLAGRARLSFSYIVLQNVRDVPLSLAPGLDIVAVPPFYGSTRRTDTYCDNLRPVDRSPIPAATPTAPGMAAAARPTTPAMVSPLAPSPEAPPVMSPYEPSASSTPDVVDTIGDGGNGVLPTKSRRAAPAAVSVSTGEEFVAVLANSSIETVQLLNDIALTEADWETTPWRLPVVRSRPLAVSGGGGGAAFWPVLNLGNITSKVKLEGTARLSFSYLVMQNVRDVPLSLAPGLDVLTRTTSTAAALVELTNVVLVLDLCLPHEEEEFADMMMKDSSSKSSTISAKRSTVVSTTSSQDGCVNTTASSLPPDPLSRCWCQRGLIMDMTVPGSDLDADDGRETPMGYTLALDHVTYLCNQQLPESCVAELGPLGCFLSRSKPPPLMTPAQLTTTATVVSTAVVASAVAATAASAMSSTLSAATSASTAGVPGGAAGHHGGWLAPLILLLQRVQFLVLTGSTPKLLGATYHTVTSHLSWTMFKCNILKLPPSILVSVPVARTTRSQQDIGDEKDIKTTTGNVSPMANAVGVMLPELDAYNTLLLVAIVLFGVVLAHWLMLLWRYVPVLADADDPMPLPDILVFPSAELRILDLTLKPVSAAAGALVLIAASDHRAIPIAVTAATFVYIAVLFAALIALVLAIIRRLGCYRIWSRRWELRRGRRRGQISRRHDRIRRMHLSLGNNQGTENLLQPLSTSPTADTVDDDVYDGTGASSSRNAIAMSGASNIAAINTRKEPFLRLTFTRKMLTPSSPLITPLHRENNHQSSPDSETGGRTLGSVISNDKCSSARSDRQASGPPTSHSYPLRTLSMRLQNLMAYLAGGQWNFAGYAKAPLEPCRTRAYTAAGIGLHTIIGPFMGWEIPTLESPAGEEEDSGAGIQLIVMESQTLQGLRAHQGSQSLQEQQSQPLPVGSQQSVPLPCIQPPSVPELQALPAKTLLWKLQPMPADSHPLQESPPLPDLQPKLEIQALLEEQPLPAEFQPAMHDLQPPLLPESQQLTAEECKLNESTSLPPQLQQLQPQVLQQHPEGQEPSLRTQPAEQKVKQRQMKLQLAEQQQAQQVKNQCLLQRPLQGSLAAPQPLHDLLLLTPQGMTQPVQEIVVDPERTLETGNDADPSDPRQQQGTLRAPAGASQEQLGAREDSRIQRLQLKAALTSLQIIEKYGYVLMPYNGRRLLAVTFQVPKTFFIFAEALLLGILLAAASGGMRAYEPLQLYLLAISGAILMLKVALLAYLLGVQPYCSRLDNMVETACQVLEIGTTACMMFRQFPRYTTSNGVEMAAMTFEFSIIAIQVLSIWITGILPALITLSANVFCCARMPAKAKVVPEAKSRVKKRASESCDEGTGGTMATASIETTGPTTAILVSGLAGSSSGDRDHMSSGRASGISLSIATEASDDSIIVISGASSPGTTPNLSRSGSSGTAKVDGENLQM